MLSIIFNISKKFLLVIYLEVSLLMLVSCGTGATRSPSQASVERSTILPAASTPENTASVSLTDTPIPAATPSERSSVSGQDSSLEKALTQTLSAELLKEADTLYEQAYQTYLSGDYDGAIYLCDKAIAINPASYKAYNLKGAALSFKGNYKAGMELIDKALELKPDFTYANFNKALAYKLQKDYDKALIWFDKAISLDPKDTWSYFGEACIYAERNDAKRAVELLAKAIETDPGVKEIARREHDLDNIRNDPAFIELIK